MAGSRSRSATRARDPARGARADLRAIPQARSAAARVTAAAPASGSRSRGRSSRPTAGGSAPNPRPATAPRSASSCPATDRRRRLVGPHRPRGSPRADRVRALGAGVVVRGRRSAARPCRRFCSECAHDEQIDDRRDRRERPRAATGLLRPSPRRARGRPTASRRSPSRDEAFATCGRRFGGEGRSWVRAARRDSRR